MSRVPAAFRGALLASVALALSWGASPVQAQGGLPDPYLSPALDAVLMPITPAVKRQFKLPRAATGVVVASVQPGGVGELYGFEPGEVISRVDSKLIRRPVDLDSIVGYGLDRGEQFFVFDGLWKGRKQRTIAQIDDDSFQSPVSFDKAPRWPGYRGRGFDYADWYRPHARSAASIWDETLAYVAAIIITDIFIDAITSDQAVFYYVDDSHDWPYDAYYITEVDTVFYETYSEEVYSVSYTEEVYESYFEETYSETYSEDVVYEERTSQDRMTEATVDAETGTEEAEEDEFVGDSDDGGSDEDGAEDDVLGEDGVAEEDAGGDGYAEAESDEEPASDEVYDDSAADGDTYDDPAYDDAAAEGAYEDPADDDAAGDGIYDEPANDDAAGDEAYDEPAYDDSAAEESYDEPAYDDSGADESYDEPVLDEGGDCGVDEDGVPLC